VSNAFYHKGLTVECYLNLVKPLRKSWPNVFYSPIEFIDSITGLRLRLINIPEAVLDYSHYEPTVNLLTLYHNYEPMIEKRRLTRGKILMIERLIREHLQIS